MINLNQKKMKKMQIFFGITISPKFNVYVEKLIDHGKYLEMQILPRKDPMGFSPENLHKKEEEAYLKKIKDIKLILNDMRKILSQCELDKQEITNLYKVVPKIDDDFSRVRIKANLRDFVKTVYEHDFERTNLVDSIYEFKALNEVIKKIHETILLSVQLQFRCESVKELHKINNFKS
jgi:hypothetical protein